MWRRALKTTSALLKSVFIMLIVSACNMPQNGTASATPDPLATMVASTLTAVRQRTLNFPTATVPTATATDTFPPTLTYTSTITLEPSLTFTLTRTIAPSKTPIPKPGTIAGSIYGYPYGSLPGLAIVAYQQEPPYNYSYWITGGETYYSMTSQYLIPGKYLVVAYDGDGNSGGCPTLVTVKSEETSTCDISDWSGSYPAKPVGVPSP
jgi:hypothetical protein